MYRWRQFTDLPKIKNLSPDDQRREYYRYQNKMMEAVGPSSAASSSAAGAGGGGSLKKIKNASAAIYYKMTNGVLEYSVTNFNKGTTSALATRSFSLDDSGIDWTFQSQDGGFLIWVYDNVEAKDFMLFIDINGIATEIAIDYSVDINYGSTSQHMVMHYQISGKFYFIVFDGSGLRQFTIDEYVTNVFDWNYDNSFLSGFCFQTQSDNIARLYAVRNGSSKPVLITQIDSDVQDWNVYMHDLHDRIMVRRTNRDDYSIESITVYDPAGSVLSTIDTTALATAPYVVQNGDNKTDLAGNWGTTVAYLEMLNPEYDLDNLVEGDTINGYSTLEWYDIHYLNSNNNVVIMLHTNGLTNDGNYYVVLYDDASRSFSTQTVVDSYYQFTYDFNNTNWDGTDDFKSDSVLYVFYSDYEDYDRSGNQFVYANDTLLLPVFATDTEVQTPIIFASQSDTNAFDFRNKGFHRWNDPRLGSTEISMIIDENRRDTGLFHFTDYGMGSTASIDDGGYDMYDTGNIIVADLNQIYYTHTQVSIEYNMNEDAPFNMGLPVEYFKMDGVAQNDPNLGVGSSYFTNLYPGLFVFSARNVSINQFGITGQTGLDSIYGYTYSTNFQITSSASNVYQVFVKCLYDDKSFGADPSINQLIIVNAATSSGIEHIIDPDTDEDTHSIVGLSGVATQVHYLLMAQRLGVRIEDEKLEEIARTYINMVDTMSTTETLNELNSNYRTITKLLDNTGVNFTHYKIDADRNETYTLIDNIYKNEYINNTWYGKTVTRYETRYDLEIFGDTGWTNLPDLDGRSWTTMYRALNERIGNYATTTELVMWSLDTDNYYKIDFTYWQTNGGGGFAYTRQLITEAMDEPVIAFTHSNGSGFNEVDVIEPGILELSRGSWGPLVNTAVQTDIYDEGPTRTLWNSVYAYERKVKHTLVDADGKFDTASFRQYPERDDWWVDTFHSIDWVESRSLLSFDGTWHEFDEFYDDAWGPSNFLTEDRYNQSTTLFTNDKKRTARILHKDGISGTFSLTGEPSGYVLNAETNDTNVMTIVHDETGYEIGYWELDGTLIDRYTVTDNNFVYSYGQVHSKNRTYVHYRDSEDNYIVLAFDGKKIEPVLNVADPNGDFNDMYNDRID